MIWTLNLQNMLETQFPFFIIEKTGEIPIFGIFFFSEKKINFGLYFASAMSYYVIMTLYVDWFSWFWYQWKEETLPYTKVPNNYTLGVSISSSQGVVTTPLGRRVTKKAQEDEGYNLHENGQLTVA